MRPVASLGVHQVPPLTEGKSPRHMHRGMLQPGAKAEGCRTEGEGYTGRERDRDRERVVK